MFFYIFTCFFIFFFLMKFLGALPQAPSAVCRNKATILFLASVFQQRIFRMWRIVFYGQARRMKSF